MIYYCEHCETYRDSDEVIPVEDPENEFLFMCESHEDDNNE